LGATIVSCTLPDCRSSILCFRADEEATTRAIHADLLAGGVTCALREGSVRLAPHFYNTVDEIDRVLEIVEGARRAPARAR
ncbi:MAG TPA: hypothetical protein VJ788_02170, partial [Gemmatimonadota bacterium]|nr:hypothetical protein [Gemmatimonadota bacterium]